MADICIYQLDELVDTTEIYNDKASLYVPVDSADYVETKKISIENLLYPETFDREAQDDVIEAAVGLDADGSFSSDEASNYGTLASFAAAGLAVNLNNWVKILDTQIGLINDKLFIKYYFTVPSAEMLLISSSPKTVQIGPGAGLIINPKELIGKNNFGSIAYVGGPLYLRFIGASDTLIGMSANFVQAVASMISKSPVLKEVELFANTGVEMYAVADPTAGDGDFEFIFEYELIDDFTAASSVSSSCCMTGLTSTFTNANLVANKLTINHTQNTQAIVACIIDNLGQSNLMTFTVGDAGGADPDNYITLDFGGAIAGTWRYFLVINK